MITRWQNTPESTNVQSIAFDGDTNEIIVAYKNGGVYAYNPGKTVFEAFAASLSKGQFVHRVLKEGQVEFRRLDKETKEQ